MDFLDSRYFILNKKMLHILGIWPYQKRLERYAIRSVYFFFMGVSFVPQILCVKKYFKVDSDKFIRGVTTLLYLSGVSLKLTIAILMNGKIQIVYSKVADNWKMFTDKDEIKTLLEYSEVGRMLTLGYVVYMVLAVIVFITMPYLPVVIDIVFPINGTRPRLFVLDGEYIVDKYENYNKIYIFESVCSVVSVPIFCTIDSTYAVCVQQCVALLAIVKLRLKVATKYTKNYLRDHKYNDASQQLIIKSADLHNKVIEFAQILETSYSMVFLLLMGMNCLILSVGTLVILVNLNNPLELSRYIMIFIGLMMHMFYVSYPGQQLIDRSSAIFNDAYNNEWYECSIKSQRLLAFMMLRCTKPCELTAGGIYTMNLENFGSLVKTSISYIAVFASFT
ncbi:odorant receptor 143 [Nasonia vitripennis]|uniref:Odorant receptor n=1 Tax=Nasonia vitripennis TaxID=7425 RepID=A0A7M6UPP4_NASVI|nr:odorant receptor 143 [Nasonia vitripennis]